jgi:hypothetical protein
MVFPVAQTLAILMAIGTGLMPGLKSSYRMIVRLLADTATEGDASAVKALVNRSSKANNKLPVSTRFGNF